MPGQARFRSTSCTTTCTKRPPRWGSYGRVGRWGGWTLGEIRVQPAKRSKTLDCELYGNAGAKQLKKGEPSAGAQRGFAPRHPSPPTAIRTRQESLNWSRRVKVYLSLRLRFRHRASTAFLAAARCADPVCLLKTSSGLESQNPPSVESDALLPDRHCRVSSKRSDLPVNPGG